MMEYNSGCELAVEIQMVRAKTQSTIVLVEGENDYLVFKNFMQEECHLIPGDGKDEVLEAMQLLNADGETGVVAIIDADFCRVNEDGTDIPNVFHTDAHDLEVMMVQSRAFERIVEEFGSKKKVEGFLESAGCSDLRRHILGMSAPLGYVRFLSITRGWNLDFDAPKLKNVVSQKTLAVSLETYIRQLLSAGSSVKLSTDEVVANIPEIPRELYPELAVGHELVEIIGIALRRVLGSQDAKVASKETMEKVLRLAYKWEDFRETRLYSSLLAWEAVSGCRCIQDAAA